MEQPRTDHRDGGEEIENANLDFGFVMHYCTRGYGFLSSLFGKDCWFHIKKIPNRETQKLLDNTSNESNKIFFWYCATLGSRGPEAIRIWEQISGVPISTIDEFIKRLLPRIRESEWINVIYSSLFEQLFEDNRLSHSMLEPILEAKMLLRGSAGLIRPLLCRC